MAESALCFSEEAVNICPSLRYITKKINEMVEEGNMSKSDVIEEIYEYTAMAEDHQNFKNQQKDREEGIARKSFNWASPMDVSKWQNKLTKRIRHYKNKLKKPIHVKTGKPLQDSTLKQYRTMLRSTQKEEKKISGVLDELNEHHTDWYSVRLEYPTLGEVPFTLLYLGQDWSFLGMLREGKEIARSKPYELSGGDRDLRDLLNMTEFVWFQSKFCKKEKLCRYITAAYIKVLDSMINEIKGEDLKEVEEAKRRDNVIDLNPHARVSAN